LLIPIEVDSSMRNKDICLGERFITFSEASEILGIRSYSRVSNMVRQGLLQAYELPETDRLRVKQSEIVSLIQQNEKQAEKEEIDK
jgi:hypothetical protein